MRKHLPAFARIYNLPPAYFDQAPPGEVQAFVDDYRRLVAASKKGGR